MGEIAERIPESLHRLGAATKKAIEAVMLTYKAELGYLPEVEITVLDDRDSYFLVIEFKQKNIVVH